MASAMVDVGSTALEDTTIVDQFKPRLPRPARPPSVNVISLKELDIGEPVEPKTKLYRSVWNPANGKPTPVAVKLVGKLEKDEVTVLDMLQVFHFTMEKGPIQRSSYVLVVGGSKVEVLSGIQHNNIVRFFGAVLEPPEKYGLVFELCEKGSLFDYIHTESNRLGFDLAINLSKGITCGVRYLHLDAPDAPIKHNNLTSHEVVLQEVNGELVPKITGFGYARQHSDFKLTTSCGKVHIRALLSPERIRGERSSPESDIYSVGIIMSELLSKKVPFEGCDLVKACHLVTEQRQRPFIPPSCPLKFASLIKSCWEDDPDERPTAGEVEAKLAGILINLRYRETKILLDIKHNEERPIMLQTESVPSLPTGSKHGYGRMMTVVDKPTYQGRPVKRILQVRDEYEPQAVPNSVDCTLPESGASVYPWTIDNSDVSEVGAELGSGRIGVVKKAVYRGSPVVVKGVHQFLKDGYRSYMDIVFPVEHDNIVKVLGATTYYIVLEEMPMSLERHLEQGPITDNNTLLKIALDVASGLRYLHTLPNRTIHGSIHSRNIFINQKNDAKVSDFGYINLDRELGLEPTTDMEMFHAPEGKKRTRYGIGVDIYSLGMLLIKMRTLNFELPALKKSWSNLHELAKKYTKKGQEGMYDRGRMSMCCVIEDLKELKK